MTPAPESRARPVRVLIAYVTAGAGHRRAAEALAQAIHETLPHAAVECRDALEDVSGVVRRGYPATYYFLIRYLSRVWGWCFELLDTWLVYTLAQPIRRAWNLCVTRRFIARLRQDPPDVVIATHFLPADVFSACKRTGWLAAPLVVAITDLHPHRLWLSREVDAYSCGTDIGAALAQRRGIPAARLHVLGIPTAAAFHEPMSRADVQRLFGLNASRLTVLVTSGGSTVGPFERVVRALMALERAIPGRMQLLVICGANPAAVLRLKRHATGHPMPVRVLGFIDTMPQAMAASDLVVTKAGGLTVMEALSRQLPLVIYHVIPGQERVNARYVSRHGAALLMQRPHEVAEAVRHLVIKPERLASMREAAKALSRPDAAERIARDVVRPLLEGRAIHA